MILKASQRSGGQHLAAYLLHYSQNEHIELHGLRGFAAEGDLAAAFAEIEAQAQATRCRKMFFSVSFNPPEEASTEQYEAAFAKVENAFGLETQPRAVVFHEKNGRRHAHVVWSLIDTEQNRAIKLKLYKRTLQTVSRGLYLEHGWTLPEGYKKDSKARDTNYTQEEAQQADRAELDPAALKKTVREILDRSDGLKAFQSGLAEKGLYLAKGDRGFCIVDGAGGVHNVARQAGYKKKEVEAKLGKPDHLPSVEDMQAQVKQQAKTQTRNSGLSALKQKQARERNLLQKDLTELTITHQKQRADLRRRQRFRNVEEERSRAERLRGGIIRLFDRMAELVGRRKPTTPKIIGQEREASRRRDLRERDGLRRQQRRETTGLHRNLAAMKGRHMQEAAQLRHVSRPANDMEEKPLSAVFIRAKEQREAREARKLERAAAGGRGRGRGRRMGAAGPKP